MANTKSNNKDKEVTNTALEVKDIEALKTSYQNFVNNHSELHEKMKYVYKDERERFRDENIYNAIDNIYQILTKVDITGPPKPTNEPLKLKVVSASKDDGNKPDSTLDGDTNTRWSSNAPDANIVYEIDEKPKELSKTKINKVGIAFYKGNERSTTFTISGSADKKNWTLLETAQSSGATQGLEEYSLATPAPAGTKFIKIEGKGNSQNNGWTSITAVEVFGDSGETETTTTTTTPTPPPTEPTEPDKPTEPTEPDKPTEPTEPDKPTEGGKNEIAGVQFPLDIVADINRVDDYHYNPNDGLRGDFQDNPKNGTYVNNACVFYGTFVDNPTADEDRCIKWSQAPHSKQGAIVNTYIVNIRNGDGASRARIELDHPKGYKTLVDWDEQKKGTPIKKGQLWSIMGVRRTILDKDGKVKGVKLELYEDQGITKDNKPGNKWVKLLDYTDTKYLITDYSKHGMEVTGRFDDKKGDKNIKIEKAVLVQLDPIQETE